MTSKAVFVSVILPVYNGQRFLAEAIRHILEQAYKPIEILVIDDGSTDQTAEIAAQHRMHIRYISQPNGGPSTARNRGIRMAQGEVITFLDVDDLWAPGALKRQVAYLAAHPSVDIVQGLIQQMHAVSSAMNPDQLVFVPAAEPYHFGNVGSAVYRTSVFEKVGLFDETLRYGEDADWFLRAWEQNIVKVILHEVSLYYRKHKYNATFGQDQTIDKFRLLKKHLDRCRTAQGQLTKAQLAERPNILEYVGRLVL